MLITVTAPADNERGPMYMDQALAAMHQGNTDQMPLNFEIGTDRGTITQHCRFPPPLRQLVIGQLAAQYPDSQITQVPEEEPGTESCERRWVMWLRLVPDLFPIKRYSQFEDSLNRTTADPLTALLTTLESKPKEHVRACIELCVRPARSKLQRRGRKCLRRLATPFFRSHGRLTRWFARAAMSTWPPMRALAWFLSLFGRQCESPSSAGALSTSASRLHDREEDLQAASDKFGRLLFETQIRLVVAGPSGSEKLARRKLREMAGAFGQFSVPRLACFRAGRVYRCSWLSWIRSRTFLLSTEELATLWHLPTQTVRAPTLAIVESRELPPPVALPGPAACPDLAVLGISAFRDQRRQFGILPDDRRRHVAILGKTGMGKSTLLANLLLSDIRAGRGIGLIDPHGDLAETVLKAIPKYRTNDVVLFDAGDSEYPLSFNVLAVKSAEQRPLVASGIVAAFKKLYGESWGPRLEHILRNALLALLEIPGSSLVSVLRLLGDSRFRAAVVPQLADPVVRAFWQCEFAGMPPKLQAEAIAPIQNKVGHFVSSPLLRNIVGQARSTLDLRNILDDGKVLIVNLSKGRIGDDASTLLGSLLVTSIQIAAMSRSDVPESHRRDFFLYVDEFQNFATESFATILSEARKYRLNLTIANQYLAQMDEQTADAVFGNVGTLLVFQIGARDAEILAEQLGGDVTEQDLLRLPRYQAYVRLLIDGMPSRPFSMRTLLPSSIRHDDHRPAIIRRTSRHRYARPLIQVEAEIRRAFAHA